jgi:hypothetical protein
MMRWTRLKASAAIAIVGAVALLLSLGGYPLSAQQAQYEVILWDEPLPALDPDSAEWDDVPVLDVALIPQGGVIPSLSEVSVPSVTLKAVHDGDIVHFRLEWEDETRDVEAGRPDSFADAAAIQFPVTDVESPNIAMGAAGQMVNIWQWKADLQEDLDQGFQDLTTLYPNFFKDHYPFVNDDGETPFQFPEDFMADDARGFTPAWAVGNPVFDPDRSTPVENLVAEGFGTLTAHPGVDIHGTGYWEDGRWQVVFSRDLNPRVDNTVSLEPGEDTAVAVAVWNGSNMEVGGRKQHSTFMTFSLEDDGLGILGSPWFYTVLAAVLVLVLAGAAILRSRSSGEETAGTATQEGGG